MVDLEFGVEGLGRGLFRSWWDKIGAGDYSGDDYSEYRWRVTTFEKAAVNYVKQHYERTFRASIGRLVVAGIQKASVDIGRQGCSKKSDLIHRFCLDYPGRFVPIPLFNYNVSLESIGGPTEYLHGALPKEIAGFIYDISTDWSISYEGLIRALMIFGIGFYDDYRFQGASRPDFMKPIPRQYMNMGVSEYVLFKDAVLRYSSTLSSIIVMIVNTYGDEIKSDDNEFYDEFLVVYDKVKEE